MHMAVGSSPSTPVPMRTRTRTRTHKSFQSHQLFNKGPTQHVTLPESILGLADLLPEGGGWR